MFTGLIETTAPVKENIPGSILVDLPQFDEGDELGASICVNGVCLTVSEKTSSGYRFDVSRETAARTNIGELKPGENVNIERALKLSDRLGGHMVTGHVDGAGTIIKASPELLEVELPEELMTGLVKKGSVTVDGISLTVSSLSGKRFTAALIPHTYENTNLSSKRTRARVNIETDIIGKYVSRLLQYSKGSITMEKLREHGF